MTPVAPTLELRNLSVHFETAATLSPRYTHWKDFARVRGQLDPDGRFANAYTDRVLGPST